MKKLTMIQANLRKSNSSLQKMSEIIKKFNIDICMFQEPPNPLDSHRIFHNKKIIVPSLLHSKSMICSMCLCTAACFLFAHPFPPRAF